MGIVGLAALFAVRTRPPSPVLGGHLSELKGCWVAVRRDLLGGHQWRQLYGHVEAGKGTRGRS
ncbi:hypothetical protein GCM10023220_26280 [Streptomyces ziwulingensis]|uniref:Transposase n=1 Tax=Streptomyces ziwulingensis TaxID=1045501 RepID=A0ABP9BMY2_9ACTN